MGPTREKEKAADTNGEGVGGAAGSRRFLSSCSLGAQGSESLSSVAVVVVVAEAARR